MKQLLRILSFFIVLTSWASYAQTTAITVTVTDPTGQVWAGGTISYVFKGNGNFNGQYQWQNANIPANYLIPTIVTLDGTGTGTFTVLDNTFITPALTSWQYTVCPNASMQCTIVSIPASGASNNISTVVDAALVPIITPAQTMPRAYQDSEIKTTASFGGLYYNTTGKTPRYFDGTTWHSFSGSGSVTSVASGNLSGLFNTAVSDPSGNAAISYTAVNANANSFLAGPCAGVSTWAFRFICSADSSAALAADSAFTWNVNTLNSTTINNSGQIFTTDIFASDILSYATQCIAGNQAFALGFVSNGVFTGPLISPVITTGLCPLKPTFTLAPWAVVTLSVQNGGGLIFSNCSNDSSCPSTSPGLSQDAHWSPPPTVGSACPGTPFPGPTNQPSWIFGNDLHIYTCTNTAGAVWARLI